MSRGSVPVVGVVLLAGLTVVVAASVGAVLATEPPETGPMVDLRLSVDAATDGVTLRHAGGDAVPTDTLRVRIEVDGDPLEHQPPVPFFAARGFRSGPTGPFNPATAGDWRAGQTAQLRLASTNAPTIDPGDAVRVTVSSDGHRLADLTAVAT